jgi:hypothetical protein
VTFLLRVLGTIARHVRAPKRPFPPIARAGCRWYREGTVFPLIARRAAAATVAPAWKRARTVAAALGIFLSAWGAVVLSAPRAQASVSIAVTLEELVDRATACAIVRATYQHSTWEGGRIATYTKALADRRVAGQLPDELWIRTRAGAVGDTAQIVEGEATFALGSPTLVFLRPDVDPGSKAAADHFVVVERAQGQFPLVVGDDGVTRLTRPTGVGTLLRPARTRLAKLSLLYQSSELPRIAGDLLDQRPLDDAIAQIAALYKVLHAR